MLNINANFKGKVASSASPEIKSESAKEDMYSKWPLRGLGYANEIGEVIRPISPVAANLLWLPAIGYVSADVGDKYKNNEKGAVEPSKKRAMKQLSFQLLASVFLPTGAVKVGQALTNVIASKGKTKLSLNVQEKLTKKIANSMNEGEHEVFLTPSGNVDREKFTNHIMSEIAEVDKHKKTRNRMFRPIEKVIHFLKKPISATPKPEHIKNYVSELVNNIMDTRESLLNGNKPKNVSKKLFDKFIEVTKDAPLEEKKSAAFTVIKKIQNKKLFKNNAVRSLGGLIALGTMMKPIDDFVEHVVIKKAVEPVLFGKNKARDSKPSSADSEMIPASED